MRAAGKFNPLPTDMLRNVNFKVAVAIIGPGQILRTRRAGDDHGIERGIHASTYSPGRSTTRQLTPTATAIRAGRQRSHRNRHRGRCQRCRHRCRSRSCGTGSAGVCVGARAGRENLIDTAFTEDQIVVTPAIKTIDAEGAGLISIRSQIAVDRVDAAIYAGAG